MLCQQCGQNQANVNMTMQINKQMMQMHLCNSCFREIQGKMMNSNDFTSGGNAEGFANNFQANGAAGQAGTRTQQQQANQSNGLLDQQIGRASCRERAERR